MHIYKLSGKTKRDTKKYVTLYHVSPNRLGQLMPRSKFLHTGISGLFLSPSYKSIIQDWAYYVLGKKHENHQLSIQVMNLYRELDALEDRKESLTPIELARMDEINKRLDKLKHSRDTENKAYWDSIKGYQTLYLHTIECPTDIYKEAQSFMDEQYEADPIKSYGFWGWGAQIFIQSKNLPKLKVSNVKSFNTVEFIKEYRNISSRRYMKPKMKMTPEEMEGWEERRVEKEKIAKAKAEQQRRFDEMALKRQKEREERDKRYKEEPTEYIIED